MLLTVFPVYTKCCLRLQPDKPPEMIHYLFIYLFIFSNNFQTYKNLHFSMAKEVMDLHLHLHLLD